MTPPLTPDEIEQVEALCEHIRLNPMGKQQSGYCGDHRTFKLSCQHTDHGGMTEESANAIIQSFEFMPRLLSTLRAKDEAVNKYARHTLDCHITQCERAHHDAKVCVCDCGFTQALEGETK